MPEHKMIETFGADVADRLAGLAIDMALDAPEKIATHRTGVRARLVAETREVLEGAGVDWRRIVRDNVARKRERPPPG